MKVNTTVMAILMAGICLLTSASLLIGPADAAATDMPDSKSDVRLQIYGNANGDDYFDSKDIEVLNKIISEGISNWEATYFYADANQDGVIDSKDVQIVQDIIDKKPAKMYYTTFKGNTGYVNYPIGRNIMCDYSMFELLCATHTFDCLMAVDQSATIYNGKYDGISDCIVIPTNGNNAEHTFESLTDAMTKGVETLVQWTGGGASDYLWAMSNIDILADELNIVSLMIQGPDCINGALMFAQMLGEPSLADDYKKWYSDADGLFDAIGTTIDKKTVSCIRCFESDSRGTYRMYGSQQSPALWFNKVVNFQDQYVGKTGFTVLNSFEELVSSSTEEIILMTQRRSGTTYEEFNDFCQERLDTLYSGTDQYNNGKIYMIEWEAMPFFSGPAGCYILAAYLYPEYFDIGDAYDYLQTYLDEFSPNTDADAKVGFTYTSAGAILPDDDGKDDPDVPVDEKESDDDGGMLMYVAIAIVVVIVAAVAVVMLRKNH